MRALWVILALLLAPMGAGAQAINTTETDAEGQGDMAMEIGTETGFQAWLADFRPRALAAGIAPDVLDAALKGLTFQEKIVERDRNQNEFSKMIWEYLDTAVSEDRVSLGRAALARHADLLGQIEAQYGVEAEVVAAIWGLESAYGTYRGDIPTIGSLATLAYDARRSAFFETQLIAALRILQNGDVSADAMRGSWAGAMGHTQFMPTSWADFAVDFDGDGKRNIWGDDPADALASAANYLRHWGWSKGALWGLEVKLPDGFDYGQTTERIRKPVAEWAALGVVPMAGGDLPDHGLASILLPGGARGAAFLIFSNFQVIEKYNTADAYVVAIGHLSDRLKGGPAIAASWPRDLRALTLPERRELQELLTRKGFDAKGIDGRMGPNTIAAIKSWQKANGLLTDGFPSTEVLDALRR